jgi:glycosyltransferase involved in cell wall biosynthesis
VIRLVEIIATLDLGGAETQLAETTARLDRRRFEPRVIALTRGGPLERRLAEAGVPLEVVGKRGKADPGALLRLARRLRALDPDVVHTHLFTANAYGRAAARAARLRAALVASEESTDPAKPAWARAIDRRLAPATARVVCVSEAVRAAQESRGIPPAKLVVVPPGVDVESIRLRATEPPEPWRTVTVCRLEAPKDVETLLAALALLRARGRPATLDVAGDGPDRPRLEAAVARLGLLGAVRLLGAREDIPALLARAPVFALSTRYEGLGVAILEAMALARPVVASAVGGVPEAVAGGETGLLVPPGDPGALASALEALHADPARARALGEAGLARVRARFTIEARVAALERIFEEEAARVRDRRRDRG